jgi:uncharacterized protein YneF (UPF0154 family)
MGILTIILILAAIVLLGIYMTNSKKDLDKSVKNTTVNPPIKGTDEPAKKKTLNG